jgi:hypothetical protein
MIIDRREDHRGLMEFIQKTLNNKAVAIFRGRGRSNLNSPAAGEAFALFTEAETIADALNREQSALLPTPGSAGEIPKLNIRSMSLGGEALEEITYYPDLPLDLNQIRFLPHSEGNNPFVN